MDPILAGKRILVTQAACLMGPAICEALAQHSAIAIANTEPLTEVEAAAAVINAAGVVNMLVVNLAILAPTSLAIESTEAEWQDMFAALVDPLPRLFLAVLPQMIERRVGKILVIGSASALRGMKRSSTYSAARGVQSVGVEVALHNVQVNAIAQNFVKNPTHFPAEVQANPRFQDRLRREVPLGRLVSAKEDAAFVAYLCSEAANCFVGQVFPVCGGWVTR